MSAQRLHRRDLLKLSAAGVIGYSMSGWIEALANQTAGDRRRRKSCILLWMNGGPSQIDTFDPKPGHPNGGAFRAIPTSVPDIRISEHLPLLAAQMRDIAIVRSMRTTEMDHGRASHLLRTGHLPMGSIDYPSIGALVSKELGARDNALPNFVGIAPYRLFNQAAYSSGFLGPQYAPLVIADAGQAGVPFPNGDYEQALRVHNLAMPAGLPRPQVAARIGLLEEMDKEFAGSRPGVTTDSHRTAYDRAARLMLTTAGRAFQLDEEQARLRDRYGRNLFGQGCLLARRLVERGVPFVEVSLGTFGLAGVNNNTNAFGWDTHADGFNIVRRLSEILDAGWATLMADLRDRGLLDSTLIVWMGEFGRSPTVNPQGGREHWNNAFSTVLAGGGIRGGQVIGATSADGSTVEGDRAVSVPDLLATVCRVLGIDPASQNISNAGRPIRIVDAAAQPIRSIL